VENVALSVVAGERRALIGPNGAGKTTLFNLISGDLPPSGGRITLFGQDVTHLPPHRRAALGVARTYQITNLFPSLTVLENLLLAVQALERTKLVLLKPVTSYAHLYARARTTLESVGLGDKEGGGRISTASNGSRNRHGLACRPRTPAAGRADGGLSPAESRMMTELLKRLNSGITLIVIEHDMDVAFALTDRVTVLHNGSVVADGSRDEVKANPLVREIYLGGA
jgi:branched-chain amino acid transport system ATP-binding protein